MCVTLTRRTSPSLSSISVGRLLPRNASAPGWVACLLSRCRGAHILITVPWSISLSSLPAPALARIEPSSSFVCWRLLAMMRKAVFQVSWWLLPSHCLHTNTTNTFSVSSLYIQMNFVTHTGNFSCLCKMRRVTLEMWHEDMLGPLRAGQRAHKHSSTSVPLKLTPHIPRSPPHHNTSHLHNPHLTHAGKCSVADVLDKYFVASLPPSNYLSGSLL